MTFNKEWLSDPELEKWVLPDAEDPSKCRCSFCNITFKEPNKSTLMRHAQTSKAQEQHFGVERDQADQFFQRKEAPSETHQAKVSRCELVVTSFFAEHGLSYVVADHFWKMSRHAAPDSELLKAASAGRTQMRYLMVHGLAHEVSRVTKLCDGRKFSTMLDESTDISV